MSIVPFRTSAEKPSSKEIRSLYAKEKSVMGGVLKMVRSVKSKEKKRGTTIDDHANINQMIHEESEVSLDKSVELSKRESKPITITEKDKVNGSQKNTPKTSESGHGVTGSDKNTGSSSPQTRRKMLKKPKSVRTAVPAQVTTENEKKEKKSEEKSEEKNVKVRPKWSNTKAGGTGKAARIKDSLNRKPVNPNIEELPARCENRLSDANQAQHHRVNAAEILEECRKRAERIYFWARCLTIITIVVVLICTVALMSGVQVYIVMSNLIGHYEALRAQSEDVKWSADCGVHVRSMHRRFPDNSSEYLECRENPRVKDVRDAEWTEWSQCIEGHKRRWKKLQKNVQYIIGHQTHMEEDTACV